MNCCNAIRSSISDWTYGDRVHKFCHNCGSHLWQGQIINRHEWFNWINYGNDGEPFNEFMKRTKEQQ